MATSCTPVLPNICLSGDANDVRALRGAGVCDVKCSGGKDLPRQGRKGGKGIKQSPAEKAAG